MKKTLTLISLFCLSAVLTLAGCAPAATTAAATTAAATTAAAESTTAAATTTATAEETTVAATSAATEDPSWEKVQSAGKLIMGLDDNFPPMGFRDAQNNIVGFDIDLAKEVTKRLGLELELLPIDWKMKQNELDAGNVDVLWNGYSFTDERNEANTLSPAYLGNDQVVIVMASSGITDLSGLSGKKLALQEESSAQQALDAAVDFKASLAEVIPFKDNVTAFLDLQAGMSDGLLVDKVVGEYYIAEQANPADYVELEQSLAPETYVIGFRKGEVALMEKIVETLQAMKADGTLAEIATTWFGSDVTILE